MPSTGSFITKSHLILLQEDTFKIVVCRHKIITLNQSKVQFFLQDSCLFREEFISSDSSSPEENYGFKEKTSGSCGKNYGSSPKVKNSYAKNLILPDSC